MDKTTKGFVIAACTVVIAAGGWAVYEEGSRLWAHAQRESRLQAAQQQRLENCTKLASNPNREKWNWSGAQEWKQWALSHADFPAFKEKAIEWARTSEARQQQWIKDNEERIKEAAARAEEQRLTDMKHARRLMLFFLGLIVTVSIAGQLVSQYAPKTAPASTEQRGS